MLSTSHGWGGASLHVRTCTQSPYLRIRLTNCAKIWCVARDPIVTRYKKSEVGWLHIRTCVSSFVVSKTAEPWHWSHTQKTGLSLSRSLVHRHTWRLTGAYKENWMVCSTIPSNYRREQLSTRHVSLKVRVGVLPHSTLCTKGTGTGTGWGRGRDCQRQGSTCAACRAGATRRQGPRWLTSRQLHRQTV